MSRTPGCLGVERGNHPWHSSASRTRSIHAAASADGTASGTLVRRHLADGHGDHVQPRTCRRAPRLGVDAKWLTFEESFDGRAFRHIIQMQAEVCIPELDADHVANFVIVDVS